jgi:hypothetical protein
VVALIFCLSQIGTELRGMSWFGATGPVPQFPEEPVASWQGLPSPAALLFQCHLNKFRLTVFPSSFTNQEPGVGPHCLVGMATPTTVFNKNRRKRRSSKKGYDQLASEYKRARERAFGSLGGASPVKRIDPTTGKVVAVLDPETGAPLRRK